MTSSWVVKLSNQSSWVAYFFPLSPIYTNQFRINHDTSFLSFTLYSATVIVVKVHQCMANVKQVWFIIVISTSVHWLTAPNWHNSAEKGQVREINRQRQGCKKAVHLIRLQ